MTPRLNYGKTAPGAYKAMEALERYLETSGLEESLIYLIKLRASQINGCAYCLDMHWKDLRALGEPDQRLYLLDAWEESCDTRCHSRHPMNSPGTVSRSPRIWAKVWLGGSFIERAFTCRHPIIR